MLTQPEVILGYPSHLSRGGSDIIETNTFTATAVAQADYGMESVVYEINLQAAQLAKQAAAEWTRPDARTNHASSPAPWVPPTARYPCHPMSTTRPFAP